jgi:hypothetical protein
MCFEHWTVFGFHHVAVEIKKDAAVDKGLAGSFARIAGILIAGQRTARHAGAVQSSAFRAGRRPAVAAVVAVAPVRSSTVALVSGVVPHADSVSKQNWQKDLVHLFLL